MAILIHQVFSTNAVKEKVMAAGPDCGLGSSFTDRCQSQNDENILLQLLQFKTHLLEVVEELHIRRDTEERFEEQISKLVLEKQELEWEKESLQHQIETKKNQHLESLSKANKQSRYQVSAEQKDKDIHNLKEELKSLQLMKYNLEKKSSELEQKLVLQSRSKDSHLNQLGEVEKRFSALSRQCAMVKQAHQKLEQNADEAMKLNKNLTSTNKKQEDTIASLNKEMEELRKKLVKAKMSCFNPDKKEDNAAVKDQSILALRQKLNMEYEINRKFKDDNKALQADKQDVLRSLQYAHQLLSNQTQAASRLELCLQTQRQQYQSLEQDHKAMQGKEKAMEEKIKHLMEEYTVSKNNWDKEKAEVLDQLKSEQQELVKIKEAYEKLHQNHTELSSKAKEQAQQISELELKVKDLDLSVVKSNFTVEANRSFSETMFNTELSSSVHTLAVAEDSDGPKGKVTPIPFGGHAEHNEGSTSEILIEPNKTDLSVTVSKDTITTNTSIDKDVPDLNSESVSAEAVTWMEFNSAHISSPVTTTGEFERTNAIVKLNMENVFQTIESRKDNDAVMSDFLEKENRDGHTQENCENATENVTFESEIAVIEDRAIEVKEITDSCGAAVDASMTENANIGLPAAERQSQATKPNVDENQLPTAEDTSYNSKSEGALEGMVSMNEKVIQTPPIQEITRQEVVSSKTEAGNDDINVPYTCPGQSPTVVSAPSSACRDLEEKTESVSKESTSAELPETLNKSSLCQSQDDASQLDGVSVQENTKMQAQVVSPPDTLVHVKDTVDNHVQECSSITEDIICPKSLAEIPELKTDPVVMACETSKNLTNDNENNCENKQVDIQQVNILDKSNLKCKHPISQGTTESHDSQKEFISGWNLSKSTTKNLMSWPSERDLKADDFKSQSSHSPEWLKNPIEKEAKMSDEIAAPNKKEYRSSFEWGSAQRRAQISMTMSDKSAHNCLLTTLSQTTSSNTSGYTSHASNPLSMFLRSKHNKFPLTIMKTTDLLNGSSVCGTSAASSWRLQPSEWKAIRETHRDTAAPKENTVSQSEPSCLNTTSSGTISKQEEEKSGSPMSGCDPSCSQDTEDQQSSFRAQISKIEQFLSTERLRLPKRRKTEN